MLATVRDVERILNEMMRPGLAEEWDNVGFLIGRADKTVKVILGALDFSREVCEQAIALKADMIVTHHPAIFTPMKSLTDRDWRNELVLRAAEHGIAVYSAHTNLDSVLGGVNDVLAKTLELENIESFNGEDGALQGIGRIGSLPEPLTLEAFIARVKCALRLEHVGVAGSCSSIKRVAVCGGSGMSFLDEVIAAGADIFVTGDVKYHAAQDAVAKGLTVIDAGHQGTELLVVNDFADRLALRLARANYDARVLVARETHVMRII
jgi:dinuclear metal center YbgI/SA1388 family protein